MNKSYRDLVAWQKAMDLVTAVYQISASFPKEELYGLTSQLRRAAVSVPSNIAEGQGRRGAAEFRHFLMIAERLRYVSPESANQALNRSAEVGKVLNGLINSLEREKLTTGY
jgi:hypothetical protein